MNIAIVGAGWTGCHLALQLRARGARVTIFERHARPLGGASGTNQCRLHLGFHYPRSFRTVRDLAESFPRFLAHYPGLALPIRENLYAVADEGSLVDFDSYCALMKAHGARFDIVDPTTSGLRHVEGALRCDEMAIDNEAAAKRFAHELKDSLRLSCPASRIKEQAAAVSVNGERFDFVVNASYNCFRPLDRPDFKYEVCLIVEYTSARFRGRSLTVMDGKFGSLYPRPGTGTDRHLLSGVEETVLGRFESPEEAGAALAALDQRRLHTARTAMESKITHYLPSFPDSFSFVDFHVTIKTKPLHEADSRRWFKVRRRGRVLDAFSAKITNLFPVADEVLALLAAELPRAEKAVA